ncbi:MAG: class I SAM-dependent methyltransferase [Halioglobus sp.]
MKPVFECKYCQQLQFDIITDGMRDWEYGVEGKYSWYQCRSCAGVQLQPFPGLDDLKLAYDIDYHGYATGEKRGLLFSLLYGAKERVFRRQMSRLVTPVSKVLDVGCGAGEFLLNMKALGVGELEGIDFSQDMVTALERHDIAGFCGTFPEFAGAPDSYDLVSMNNYLEHTLEPPGELAKAFALLRPGAHLVGEVPGFDSWERRIFGRYWGGNHVPRHTYQFNADFLARLLADAGFEEIKIRHQLNTSHWALSVQNFLQRKVGDLRENPAIKHGRSGYYVPLLLLFIPVNIVCVLLKKSGCVKFSARKPDGDSSDG